MRAWIVVVGVVAVWCWTAGSAQACSCFSPVLYEPSPAEGAVDVPLDVRPWFSTTFVRSEDVTLLGPDGQTVPITVERGPSHDADVCAPPYVVEVIPTEPLQPHATYTLRAVDAFGGGQVQTVTFTTGAAALGADQSPPPPAVRFAIAHAPNNSSSCAVSKYVGCFDATGDLSLEVTVSVADDDIGTFISDGSPVVMLSEELLPLACYEIRARDAAGHLSAPVAICARDVEVRTVSSDDIGVRCDPALGVVVPVVEDPTQTGSGGVMADAGTGDGGAADMGAGSGGAMAMVDAGTTSGAGGVMGAGGQVGNDGLGAGGRPPAMDPTLAPSAMPSASSSASGDGCSVSSVSAGAGAAWPCLLALLVVVARRRRARGVTPRSR